MAILITGGAGYIGSHTTLTFLNTGQEVVVLDNLVNASYEALKRVKEITNRDIIFYQGDINNSDKLKKIFLIHDISAIIHFAGLKSVSESMIRPLEYYKNNVIGTLNLLDEMKKYHINKMIFSSSATVYGIPDCIPLKETSRTGETTNPYGSSKYMIEKILKDFARTETKFSITILRYFNPVGAHQSGFIGEDPKGIPNNLMPFISQVASGKLSELAIFGNDYPTIDGTGVRDYIHVMDLAEGHLKALEKISPGLSIYNLGTGTGYSVFQMLRAFENVSGQVIPFKILPRRDGDIAECWADTSLAEWELGWKAKRGLKEIMRDTWNWQKNNPDGYQNQK